MNLKQITQSLAALGLGLSVSFPTLAEIKEVTLLHTNDIESVYQPIDAFWDESMEGIGGIAHLATLIEQERDKATAEGSTYFQVDAGDIFTGSLTKRSFGRLAFDLYDVMGYDVITLGNHEFEYGWERLREVMPRASYPVLCANIFYEGTDITLAQPYTIIERDGIKMGVIGVMGIDAYYNTMWEGNRRGLEVRDPIEVTQHYIDFLKDEVDFTVILTHQNLTAPMQSDKQVDEEVQRGIEEDYEMAGKLRGADIIIGGHSDNGLWEPVVHPKTGTIIGMTFGQGMHLGHMKLLVDTENGGVKLEKGKLITVNADKIPAHPRAEEMINEARDANPDLSEVIAELDDTAARRYVRESRIGNLLTDIIREAGEADIAMLSSGSIRVDFNQGPITVEQAMNAFPFTDKLTVVELTGENLKELLEYSYTLPYGLAQFSGIKTTYDMSKPENKRLVSLEVNGKAVKDTDKYRVATYSFAASGGDGYTVFSKGKVLKEEGLVMDIIIDGLRERKDIVVPQLGRQIDISK